MKRFLGQHFLRDSAILKRIIRSLALSPGDTVLEIGAGHGALTRCLAPLVGRLFAVEIDEDCFPVLKSLVDPFPSVSLIHGDILHLDLQEYLRASNVRMQDLRVVGNLPYNIGTPIVERLLSLSEPVQDLTLLLQLEVAQRIVALPGTRAYGYFSVLCQHLADVRLAFRVMPGSFVPQPKVVSALVHLRPTRISRSEKFEVALRQVTKAAFGHRRKTLQNSLQHDTLIGPQATALLDTASIDGTRRAETLTIDEFRNLAHALVAGRAGEDFPQAPRCDI